MSIDIDEPTPAVREAFGVWLLGQSHRSGWIGDLAKAAKADRGFPRDGDPETIRARLAEKQADSDMMEAVDDAEHAWRSMAS